MDRPVWLILLLTLVQPTFAQQPSKGPYTEVDREGVIRWSDTGEELYGFGANYTVPFAHAFRSAKKLGLDPLEQIDRDVYHLSRLGFDLYRVHVWDTEISDTLGNLIYNEHFHAFDYLLSELAKRGFNYVLTPIAFWGNGWPEPDEDTPGFSAKYGKGDCLTNPDAIAAQENYLEQFMSHVNPYTGVAYRDDPHLVAVEISNEPHHREEPAAVTTYIKKMVKAVKRSGYRGPVFYNISHSVHLVDAYFAAGIDGGTFQWYPTGLGYQRPMPGNILPAVDDYDIPFDDRIKAHEGAKLVYEFDAADVHRSYVYPAMARSFREAGIQIATHFSYDPLFLAYANTEYNTHYMNLAYVPQKAIALMIAGEVFRQWPMCQDAGIYPENKRFGPFLIDEQKDLALLDDGSKYFYSNSHTHSPRNPEMLSQVAGCGTSPIVDYPGSGAYFLDRIKDGVWRLEVMPDPLVIRNPYGRNSLDKTIAVVQWNEHPMRITLPDLGQKFSLNPLNEGNEHRGEATNREVPVLPGAYLLIRDGATYKPAPEERVRNLSLYDFVAPPDGMDKDYYIHAPVESAVAGHDLRVSAQVAAPEGVESVQLMLSQGYGRPMMIELDHSRGFQYEGVIAGEQLSAGFVNYYLVVQTENKTITYPAGKEGMPYQWNFYDREPYSVRVVDASAPITLFEAENHTDYLMSTRWSRNQGLQPYEGLNSSVYEVQVEQLFREDSENLNGAVIQDFSIRYPFADRLEGVRSHLESKSTLTLLAGSGTKDSQPVQVALVMDDGSAFGGMLTLAPGMKTYEMDVEELKPVATVILPRPYPTFLPYYFEQDAATTLDLSRVESLQISLDPGIPVNEIDHLYGIKIVRIALE